MPRGPFAAAPFSAGERDVQCWAWVQAMRRAPRGGELPRYREAIYAQVWCGWLATLLSLTSCKVCPLNICRLFDITHGALSCSSLDLFVKNMTSDTIDRNTTCNTYLQTRSWLERLTACCTNLSHLPAHLHFFGELDQLYHLTLFQDSSSGSHSEISSLADRHKLYTFHRRWHRFTESLISQWQIMNYVSAVFVGYVATLPLANKSFYRTAGL